MDNRFNTIAGWTLFAGIVALGASLVTGEMFHSERPEKMGYPIEGVEIPGEGGGEAEKPIAFYLASADPAKGADVFKRCVTCHTINKGGAAGTGPNLWGAMGAPVARQAGFAYSPDLKALGGNWDWDKMNAWIHNPKGLVPGTKMGFAGLGKPEDRANLLAYMNTQGDSPQPLPAAPAESPAKAAAEKSDAVPGKAADQPVLNEAQATPTKVGGEGASSVTGNAQQTKAH